MGIYSSGTKTRQKATVAGSVTHSLTQYAGVFFSQDEICYFPTRFACQGIKLENSFL